MMRHDVNQHATEATRRAGAYAAAEAKRQRRAQAKDIATERLAEMTAPALTRLEELLGSEQGRDPSSAVRTRPRARQAWPGDRVERPGRRRDPDRAAARHDARRRERARPRAG